MIGQPPPFALATPVFRFRALAAHAGRAALGGDREVALACFGAARLAAGLLPEFLLAPGDAAARVASTRHWMASLALPVQTRVAAVAAIDAVGTSDRKGAAAAIMGLSAIAADQLDAGSVEELNVLIQELNGGT